MKAGWQPLPELQLSYVHQVGTGGAPSVNSGPQSGKGTPVPAGINSTSDSTSNTQPSGIDPSDPTGENVEAKLKAELDSLVKRWMPKMVFIHVSIAL